jgi:hypothetical protein
LEDDALSGASPAAAAAAAGGTADDPLSKIAGWLMNAVAERAIDR